MISEGRMKHILTVARQCYSIAKEKGYDEDYARKMFAVGFLHDIGYEFAENDTHGETGASIAVLIGVDPEVVEAIRKHGKENDGSVILSILNEADMMTDGKGNAVGIEERLKDIKERYGETSPVYEKCLELCESIRKSG